MTCAAWQTTSAPSSRLAGLQLCYLISFSLKSFFFRVEEEHQVGRSTQAEEDALEMQVLNNNKDSLSTNFTISSQPVNTTT